jgi:thiol-disulfide isomerase/thioredoxin
MSQPYGVILKANDFQVKNGSVMINPRKINGNPGMLLIQADFCIHCKRFIPTFNEICKNIGNDFACVSIESKELSGADALSNALDFQGFPTIKFFSQDGKIIGEYQGDRSKSSILAHICKVYHHCMKG